MQTSDSLMPAYKISFVGKNYANFEYFCYCVFFYGFLLITFFHTFFNTLNKVVIG